MEVPRQFSISKTSLSIYTVHAAVDLKKKQWLKRMQRWSQTLSSPQPTTASSKRFRTGGSAHLQSPITQLVAKRSGKTDSIDCLRTNELVSPRAR